MQFLIFSSGKQPVQNIKFRGQVRGKGQSNRGGYNRRDDRGQQPMRRGHIVFERENSETQRGLY